jgi:hypothetical protein
MTPPTRTDYLAFARASSEDHHIRLTNVMTQEMYYEPHLDKIEPNTLYMMVVSRNDYMTSWGYIIQVNDAGEIKNAINLFLDEALEEQA